MNVLLLMGCASTGARSANAFTYNTLEEIPQVDTLTYEGVFNENYFRVDKQTDQLTDLEISMAQVVNPLNGKLDQWLGLLSKSKFDGIGLREPIDIVVSLDTSGSMGNIMNSNRGQSKSRFELAKIGIFKLIDLLEPTDGFGFTKFELTSETIIPLTPVSKIKEEHRQMITDTKKQGGTNLYNGLLCAYETIKSSTKRSKRIMFVTDLEDKSFGKELVDLFNQCSKEGIYITIIGIGYEVNTALAETLSHIRGGNYFLAQTEEELDKFLVQGFKYICFPCTFEHKLEFKSNNLTMTKCIGTGFKVPKVEFCKKEWMVKSHHESTQKFKNQANFLLLLFKRLQKRCPLPVVATFCNYLKYEMMTFCNIDTSFPSHLTSENNSFYLEGGLILLRLTKESSLVDYCCDITTNCLSYEGTHESKTYTVKCPQFSSNDEFFSNDIIQNGLSLYYYSKLCRTIMKAENGTTTKPDKEAFKQQIRDRKEDLKNSVIAFMEKHFVEQITMKKKTEYIHQLRSLVTRMNDNTVKRRPQQQQQDDEILFDNEGCPYLYYYGKKVYLN